jgi:hypothetical protein
MFDKSRLVTQRPTERPGGYHRDRVLSEREFTRWLTLGQREIPEGPKDTGGDRVSAYQGGLLDEFFATVHARIAFWLNAREAWRAKHAARTGGNGQTAGKGDITLYVERLEWVARQASDPWFAARSGSEKFSAVAIALKYGIDSAMRYLGGGPSSWSQDDCQHAVWAYEELEFLIYLQRGTAVQFTPPSPSCDLLYPTRSPGSESQASAPPEERDGE